MPAPLTFDDLAFALRDKLLQVPGQGYAWGDSDPDRPAFQRCHFRATTRAGARIDVSGETWEAVWSNLPDWLTYGLTPVAAGAPAVGAVCGLKP